MPTKQAWWKFITPPPPVFFICNHNVLPFIHSYTSWWEYPVKPITFPLLIIISIIVSVCNTWRRTGESISATGWCGFLLISASPLLLNLVPRWTEKSDTTKLSTRAGKSFSVPSSSFSCSCSLTFASSYPILRKEIPLLLFPSFPPRVNVQEAATGTTLIFSYLQAKRFPSGRKRRMRPDNTTTRHSKREPGPIEREFIMSRNTTGLWKSVDSASCPHSLHCP